MKEPPDGTTTTPGTAEKQQTQNSSALDHAGSTTRGTSRAWIPAAPATGKTPQPAPALPGTTRWDEGHTNTHHTAGRDRKRRRPFWTSKRAKTSRTHPQDSQSSVGKNVTLTGAVTQAKRHILLLNQLPPPLHNRPLIAPQPRMPSASNHTKQETLSYLKHKPQPCWPQHTTPVPKGPQGGNKRSQNPAQSSHANLSTTAAYQFTDNTSLVSPPHPLSLLSYYSQLSLSRRTITKS